MIATAVSFGDYGIRGKSVKQNVVGWRRSRIPSWMYVFKQQQGTTIVVAALPYTMTKDGRRVHVPLLYLFTTCFHWENPSHQIAGPVVLQSPANESKYQ